MSLSRAQVPGVLACPIGFCSYQLVSRMARWSPVALLRVLSPQPLSPLLPLPLLCPLFLQSFPVGSALACVSA
jgi:hypothetical protein